MMSPVFQQKLFLEMLFLQIRGETLKFSSPKKKEHEIKEKSLLKDMETLEAMEEFCALSNDLLDDKKEQLEILRKKRLKVKVKDVA